MVQQRPWTALYDADAHAFDAQPVPDATFEEALQTAAKENGSNPFVTTALPNGWTATLDFASFDDATRRVARYLRETLKLQDGAVIAVQGPNAISTVVAMVGVIRAGLIITNLNPLYTTRETQRQLADSKAEVLFISDLFSAEIKACLKETAVRHIVSLSLCDLFGAAKKAALKLLLRRVKRLVVPLPRDIPQSSHRYIRALQSNPAKDDDLAAYQASRSEEGVALIQYSGGTTGIPNAAQLTLRGLMINLAQGTYHAPRDAALRGQRILLVLPVYHMFGLYMIGLGLLTRNHLILAPSPRPLDNLKKTFEAFRPTILPGVSSLFAHLMDTNWFEAHARIIDLTITGATPLDPNTAARWLEMTAGRMAECYGLTEATTILTQNPGDDRFRAGTAGFPVPGTHVAIKKDDGSWAGPGEPGEVCAKGPQLMIGYAGGDASEAFDENGWLMTGDIGQMDKDGYLTLLDRKKDMLLVGGFNVFPAEIESVLNAHPAVIESAVVGVPDETGGERAYAFVVPAQTDVDMQSVIAHCQEHLTRYKCPVGIRVLEALPKSPVGKILRRVLREDAKSEVSV
ncbi:MAG: AMP-binding protein [Sphingomonadales bacterium]